LSPDGVFTGRYTEARSGSQQYALRSGFTRDYTADERRQIARALANNVFEGASGDSLELFNGRDLRATPRVSVWITGARAAQRAGGQLILTLPLRSYSSPAVVADLEGRTTRRFPIDVAQVLGPVEEVSELRLRLPDGWRARLPDAVTAESEFGSYRAEYRQEGPDLIVVRRVAGRKGVEAPAKIGALLAWLRAVAQDEVKYIVVERGA
jgi:hypothetical protein